MLQYKLTKKDIAAILYKYYIDNEMETDFSFDNGETISKVKSHYSKLSSKLGIEEEENLFSMVEVHQLEGSDYEYLNIQFEGNPDKNINGCDDIILQVTAMHDYDGKSCSDKYTGSEDWADVGIFYLNDEDVDFDEIPDEQY